MLDPRVKRYATVDDFCEENGLSYPIPTYMKELNNLWIRTGNDPKSLREYLRGQWESGELTVRGVCEWITRLVRGGAHVEPPIFGPDGKVLIFKSEARDELLKELRKTYHNIILASLDADQRLLQALSTKTKLIWALLGYRVDDVNLAFYLGASDEIVEAKLLPLLKAKARAEGQNSIPNQLVELERTVVTLLAPEEETVEEAAYTEVEDA